MHGGDAFMNAPMSTKDKRKTQPKFLRDSDRVVDDLLLPSEMIFSGPNNKRQEAILHVLRRIPDNAYSSLVVQSDFFDWSLSFLKSRARVREDSVVC